MAKNYMSFNVITGPARTDSLIIALCRVPLRAADRNMHRVFVQSLMTTAHPVHGNPFISVRGKARRGERGCVREGGRRSERSSVDRAQGRKKICRIKA